MRSDSDAARGGELQGYLAGAFAALSVRGRLDAVPRFLQRWWPERELGASQQYLEELEVDAEARLAFLRGFFDCAGSVSSPRRAPQLLVTLERPPREWFDEQLIVSLGTPTRTSIERFEWTGAAALDLLGKLYETATLGRPKHLRRYRQWCQSIAHVAWSKHPAGVIRALRLDPAAVIPHKQRVSDSGYDLVLLAERKRVGQTILFGTGIAVEPPDGWYFDVVGRSSIIKTGYIVSNSVGIIDRSYRGEILVPLLKIDLAAPDLSLPARVVQLVPRPIVHFSVSLEGDLSQTERGAGGFGSSG